MSPSASLTALPTPLGAFDTPDALKAILDSMGDGFTVQAPDGRLVFANQLAADLLGCRTVDDLLHTPVSQVLARFDLYTEDGLPFPLERLPGRRVVNGETPPW